MAVAATAIVALPGLLALASAVPTTEPPTFDTPSIVAGSLISTFGPTGVRFESTEGGPSFTALFVGGGAVPQGSSTEVRYTGVWPGVDLTYRAANLGPKYELDVEPGARVDSIVFKAVGSDSVSLAKGGTLTTKAGGLTVTDTRPSSWDAEGRPVDCRYELRGPLQYGFACTGWDGRTALTIDPLLLSTFIGGSQRDEAQAVALDSQGSIVVVGWTASADFPKSLNAPDTDASGGDAFVSKFSSDGTQLIFSTCFGGSGFEVAFGVALDQHDAIWITGQTNSADLATTANAYQRNASGGMDAFVARLVPDGSQFDYASYLGGSGWDRALGIAVDEYDRAVFTGETNSTSFPTTGGASLHNSSGFTDAFVAWMNGTNGSLLASGLVGGSGADAGRAVTLDANGHPFVVGSTNSSDLPTSSFTGSALDLTYNGGFDAFLLSLMGPGMVFDTYPMELTYIGGAGDDLAYSIDLDSNGYPLVGGVTDSPDFAGSLGSAQPTSGGLQDGFVARLTRTGVLSTVTLLGGDGSDAVVGLVGAPDGSITAVGFTDSGNFPVTQGALRTARSGTIVTGLQEAFFTKISADLSTFAYSSYMGEGGADIARGVAVDAGGAAVVVGATDAASFPTTSNAFDRVLNNTEAFLFRALQRRPILTLTTVPIGRTLDLNGTTVTGPYQAPCDEPALLPLTVTSPQTLGGTRYVFQNWWDGGSQNRTVDCSADTSLGLNFTVEVLLSVGSTPTGLHLRVDGVGIVAPWSAWVLRGSNHTVEAMNPLEEGGTRYLFLGWADGGPASRTLAAAAPISLVAQYTADAYSFELLSDPPGLAATVDGVNFTSPAHLWLAIGSNHTFGAPSPQPWSAGLRYAFDSWSDGGAASHPLRIDAEGSLTVRFAAEFEIALASDPSGLSVLIDGTDTVLPWSGWRLNGTGMSLAPPPSAPVVGRTMYGAMAWSDGGASSRTWTVWRPETLTALFQPVAYELLLESSPSGVPLTLEGTTENASRSFQQAGATVSVRAPENVTIGNTRYLFLRWSDTGDPTHFATVTGPLTLTAFFSRTFEVRVNATPADARFRIDGVEFTGAADLWMAEGSVHQLTAAETLSVGVGRRLAWVAWGDGEAAQHAYTASAARWLNLTYRAEVFLTIVSPGGDPACDIPNCWYPLGATATVSVKSPWNESGGRREVLRGWLGNDSSSGNAATLAMNAPDELTVLWANQFQLSVASRFSTTSGAGWYDEGAGAAFSVAATEANAGGTHYRFAGWSGDVISTSSEGLVFMDGPKSIVAVWGEVRTPPAEAPLWLIVPVMVGAAGVAALLLVRRKRAAQTLERAWRQGDQWETVESKRDR